MSAAANLINELQEAGYCLSRRGDKLHIKAPPGDTISEELKLRLLERKPELLALLTPAEQTAERSTTNPGNTSRPIVRFHLPEHEPNSWAVAIGRPGESVESLVVDLHQRWPNVEIKP